MQPTYNHCSGISGIDDSSYFTLLHFLIADIFSLGPGSHAVRQKLIMAKLAGAQNVFQDVLERSEGDFMSFHEEWSRRAADQLQEHFNYVQTDFHSRFNMQDVDETNPERRLFRKKLLGQIEEAEDELQGTIKKWFMEAQVA